MNYFTQEEAIKIQAALKKFIGQKMKYGPNEEPSTIVDVLTQPTMHEIAYYGDIQYGYLVTIVFEKHSGLVPALFCAFNGMEPIHATHEAINSGRKNQLITSKLINGDWIYKNGTDSIKISINQEFIEISENINGHDENVKFSSNGHWLNYYIFMFMDNPNYMISSANENEMMFAKIETPGLFNNKYKWNFKFKRI